MTSGGLRPGAGRPPKEHSRAKDRAAKAAEKRGDPKVIDDGTFLALPREGRTGRVPAWPLTMPDKPTAESKRERALWVRLWKSPQAMAWERVGVDLDFVALYVRYRVEAEAAGATVGVRNLVRQHADGLGLTAAGLRMLKWRIGQPPVVQPITGTGEPVATPEVPTGLSTRERLQLLAGGNGDA